MVKQPLLNAPHKSFVTAVTGASEQFFSAQELALSKSQPGNQFMQSYVVDAYIAFVHDLAEQV